MSVSYMDDNSIPVSTDNMASSQAMNPNNIVERKSADASENTPMSFSGDPIIEANIRSNAEKLAVQVDILKSSRPSGAGNLDMSETGEGFIGKPARERQ